MSGLKTKAAVFIVSMTLLAGCGTGGGSGPSGSSSGSTPKGYPVGIIMPMSGSEASTGTPMAESVVLGIKAVNKEGGVDGVPLKAVLGDSQANGNVGALAANRVISVDNVPLMIVSYSNVVPAVAPVANRNHVLEINDAANDPKIATLGTYVYTDYPLANVDVTAFAKYTYEQRHLTKAGLLWVNNNTGAFAAQVYRQVFTSLGGTIVAAQAYPPDQSNYTTEVQKVAAAHPQVIYLQGLTPDTPVVIAELREAGFTGPIESYAAACTMTIPQQIGSAADGVLCSTLSPGIDGKDPAVNAFLKQYVASYGQYSAPPNYMIYGYASAFVARALIQWDVDHHLKVTGPNLLKAMDATTAVKVPLLGTMKFSDHKAESTVYIWELSTKGISAVTSVKP